MSKVISYSNCRSYNTCVTRGSVKCNEIRVNHNNNRDVFDFRVLTTCSLNFDGNIKNARCVIRYAELREHTPNEFKNNFEITRVIYNLFVILINCDFDVNPKGGEFVNLRNFDKRLDTGGRAYVCVCSLDVDIIKVRDLHKLYFDPLNSSTDFINLFNFNIMSQFKCIDCNCFINDLISNVFIFNCKLFRQLHSISCPMASKKESQCVQGRICNVFKKKKHDAIDVTLGALKCCSATNENVRHLNAAQRHSSGPASHFTFPIVLSKMICLPVISYVYYNFIIIKNVIPKIGLKFLRTSVIVMPFYLIFYPLSGYYSELSFDNSYYLHLFQNGRMFPL